MSESTLTVTTSIRIARAPEVVRKQFADIDHAIRDRIHEGVAMQWMPPRAPGERRVRQEIRLLGRTQVDEFLLEETAEGDVIKRFVEGPHKGTVIRQSFTPQGEGGTLVEVVATVPAKGFRWAIGPLFKIAVRKTIDKTLGEQKHALEGGGYEPGRARGQLDRVLASLAPIIDRAQALPREGERVALVAPLLETACVTAIADDDADDAERDTIHALVRALGIAALDDDAVEALVASSIDQTRALGIERRCDELGARLRRLDIAEDGLTIAALVAQISHGIDQSELLVLQRLARAAGLDDAVLASIIERIDRQLSGQ